MKMTRDTARQIRAWIPGAVGVKRFKIEGSFRAGTTHDGAEVIDTNRLAFEEQDLFDFMPWADVLRHDHTTVAGEVELDLYVYSVCGRYGDEGQLEDVVVVKFDADGMVSMHDHGGHRWHRCIVDPNKDGPTLWDCPCDECRQLRRESNG